MSASYFSATYQEARSRFLNAAERADGCLSRYDNPNKGPAGEDLATDVAEFGSHDAPNVLYAVSSTHGVEGFCGSGCQIGLMESGFAANLPDNLRLVLVHAINPYGFAWIRRVTEENVDLNRNFVDHNADRYPVNAGYELLHDTFCPKEWDDATVNDTNEALTAYAAEHGPAAFQAAASGGQYHHPDGVFFGGNSDTWARTTFEEILADTLGTAKRTILIDFHTGLGEYGYGELISEEPVGSDIYQWARDWFGESVKTTASGESVSAQLSGTLDKAFIVLAGDRRALALGLEFGTVHQKAVFNAMRADNWLHLHGDLDSDQGRRIKKEMRDAFYPDKDDWKQMIWQRGLEVMTQASDGLVNS